MAKIIAVGDAAVITSSMKLEDIRLIKKYRPKALFLKGGEDGKEDIFGIDVTDGSGSVGKYGISFGKATRDDDKLAIVTVDIADCVGDIKEYITDKYGAILVNLNKLEAQLPAILDEVAAEKAEIASNISIAQ